MLASIHSPYVEPSNLSKNLERHIYLTNQFDSNFHIFLVLLITGYN